MTKSLMATPIVEQVVDVDASKNSAQNPTNIVTIGDGTEIIGLDCIWHNMYCESNFVTLRRFFSKDVDWMLLKVAHHVQQGLYRIISISASEHSFVVVCATEKQWEDLPEDTFTT